MWSAGVQAGEVLTPPQTILNSDYRTYMCIRYIMYIFYFFLFLHSLMFVVAPILEMCRILDVWLSWVCSVNYLLEYGKKSNSSMCLARVKVCKVWISRMLKASSFPHVKTPLCTDLVSRAELHTAAPCRLFSGAALSRVSSPGFEWLGSSAWAVYKTKSLSAPGSCTASAFHQLFCCCIQVFFKRSLGRLGPEPMTLRRGCSSGGVVESLMLNTKACSEFCLALNYWLSVFSQFSETLWLVYFMIASKAVG